MRQVSYLARIFASELHAAVECLAFRAVLLVVPQILACVLPGAGAINIMAANRNGHLHGPADRNLRAAGWMAPPKEKRGEMRGILGEEGNCFWVNYYLKELQCSLSVGESCGDESNRPAVWEKGNLNFWVAALSIY